LQQSTQDYSVPALGSFITWLVGARARRHNYYSTLVKLMGDHNWNRLKAEVKSGLPVTFVDEGTATVCYQHINLLLYAWLHKDLLKKDKTLEGWKRWADAIVEGATRVGHEQYGYAYRDILVHGDVYPTAFIRWLKTELQFSADRFPVPVQQTTKPAA
jgi:hypothetical protein